MTKQIRWDRLAKWPAYLREIDPLKFNMGIFRSGSHETKICNSSGCVLGHMTKYAEEALPMYETSFLIDSESDWRKPGAINFDEFALVELGIDQGSDLWTFLFSGGWDKSEGNPGSHLDDAIERIEKALEHQDRLQDDPFWDKLCEEHGFYED